MQVNDILYLRKSWTQRRCSFCNSEMVPYQTNNVSDAGSKLWKSTCVSMTCGATGNSISSLVMAMWMPELVADAFRKPFWYDLDKKITGVEICQPLKF